MNRARLIPLVHGAIAPCLRLQATPDTPLLRLMVAQHGHHDWREFVNDAVEAASEIGMRPDGVPDDRDVRLLRRVRIAVVMCDEIAAAFVRHRRQSSTPTGIDLDVAMGLRQLDDVLRRAETLRAVFEDDDE